MKALHLYFYIVLVLSPFASCTPRNNGDGKELIVLIDGSGRPLPSEEEVRNLVRNGMSKAEVLDLFGKPSLIRQPKGAGEEQLVFLAAYNPEIREMNYEFTGFQINLKENRVAGWFPVYGDRNVSDGPE